MKLNSEALNEKEAFQKLVELSPDAIAIHFEGKVIYINEACRRIMEAEKKEDLVGKPVLSFVHKNFQNFVKERMEKLLEGKILKNLVEEIFITLKGREIFVEVAASPIPYQGKKAILVVFRDITQKKKIEDKNNHLSQLLKAIHIIDQIFFLEKKVSILTDKICENLKKVKNYGFVLISRVEEKNIKNISFYSDEDFLNEIEEEKFIKLHASFLEKQKTYCEKIPFKEETFKEWNEYCKKMDFKSFFVCPIYVEKVLWGILSIYSYREFFEKEEILFLEDISKDLGNKLELERIKEEEKKARTELKISEEKLKAMLSALDDMVFAFDLKGNFTFYYTNKKENLLYPPEFFLGKNFRDVLPAHIVEKIEDAFKKVLNGEFTELEYWLEFNGKMHWYSAKMSPYYFKNKIFGVISVVRDITEKVEFETEKFNYLNKIQSTLEATVMALANAVEMRDATTYGHQARTARLACEIAKKMGLPSEKIQGLKLASHIHDVGKIGIPSEILAKPGKLLPIEVEMIKTHAQKGYEILKGINFPWPIQEIVLQHSEHIDGSGYPRGLKENQILIEAKILAVADAIDAMSSHRPYRPAFPLSEVMKEIKALSGKWYDKKVVEVAIELLNSGYKWY